MKHMPKLIIACCLLILTSAHAQTLSISHSASICAGSGTSLQVVYSGPSAASFSWTLGSGVSSSASSGTLITVSSSLCGPLVFTCSAYSAANVLLATTTGSLLNVCSSLTISPASQTLCGSSSITLTANANTSYSWSTGAATQSIVVSPTTSTNYSIYNATSICPATASITVFDIQTTASSASVCVNSTFTMAAAAAGSPSYNWFQPPTTLMSGGTSAQVVTSATALPTTYTVYAFFPASCIRSKTITMQAFTYSPAAVYPSSVCAGSPFTMTGLNANSYTWTSQSQSLQASAYTTTQSVVNTYTLRADSGSCRGNRVFQVGMYPPPNIIITSPNFTICPNQTTQLFASGAVNYTWTNSPGMMSSLYGNSVIVSPTVSTVYSVTALSAQGCKGNASVIVQVGFYPVLSIISSQSVVCAGFISTVVASGAGTYSWVGTSLTNTLLGATQTLSAGNYTLIGSTGGSCIDRFPFSIGLLPPLSLSLSASAFQTCYDNNGNAKPVQLTIAGASSYTWQPFNPAQMTFSIGPQVVVTPTVTTCYTVTGITPLCSNTASICILFSAACTGIAISELDQMIQVFPNPASTKLQISSQQNMIKNLCLYNTNGQLVYSLNDLNTFQSVLDLSAFDAGIYLLRIQTASGFQQQRIIRE